MKSTVDSLCAIFLLSVAFCSVVVMMSRRTVFALDSPPASCSDPTYRQFDFWTGDWDVFDVGNPTKVAHARIDSILEGCVLREDYRNMSGHEGQSFTIYDASRKLWHQTWVTSDGVLLEIEGRFEDGEMVLSGKNQKGEIVRGTWKSMNGEVREVAQKSADDGKTWDPWFDIMFRRAPEVASTPDTAAIDNAIAEKKIVAALDTEYQDAVKRNDAATMDRILSNDFILVTSSGKTFTKSELLDEAKSGRMAYEHQEDTDQTVRLWGDTAVVTAKLWEKGAEDGKSFEYKLWFSDVYRRTPSVRVTTFGEATRRRASNEFTEYADFPDVSGVFSFLSRVTDIPGYLCRFNGRLRTSTPPQDARVTISVRKRSQTCKYVSAWL
jgi:ketosteroid isomerase-like protein